MTRWRVLAAGLLTVLLTGCLQTTLVSSHKPQLAADRYRLLPEGQWNRITGTDHEIWTKDGLGLQELRFYNSTGDGQPMFTPTGGEEFPKFKADMKATDIADFFAASMLAGGTGVVETSNLRPFRFGGQRGFRFDVSFVTSTGVRYRGEAFGAVIAEKLNLVFYYGHEEFYFEQSRAEVEALMRTLELKT